MKQDLTKKVFGKLTVIEYVGKSPGRHSIWRCVCECGVNKNILGIHLNSGKILSCGCLKAAGLNKTHGHCSQKKRTRTYRSWASMMQRCTNKNYDFWEFYGGRGIKVSEEWKSFENFLADMGERPENCSLERVDRDGNYCVENCKWANPDEQAANRSNNVFIEYQGKKQTLKEWSDQIGIKYETLRRRIKRGWSLDRALGEL